MSKFDNKKIMPRYSVIAIIMTLMAVAVIGKTLYTMTAHRQYWMKVAEQKKKDAERKGNSNSYAMDNAKISPLARFGVPI
jgi:hypothetical protein